VEWNKPLYTPIPISKDVTYKLSNPMIPEYSNIRIATLLNQIVNMRLKVTALTNNKKMLLNNSMTMPKNDVILILKYKDLNHKLIYSLKIELLY
jgi:hypothetical protein